MLPSGRQSILGNVLKCNRWDNHPARNWIAAPLPCHSTSGLARCAKSWQHGSPFLGQVLGPPLQSPCSNILTNLFPQVLDSFMKFLVIDHGLCTTNTSTRVRSILDTFFCPAIQHGTDCVLWRVSPDWMEGLLVLAIQMHVGGTMGAFSSFYPQWYVCPLWVSMWRFLLQVVLEPHLIHLQRGSMWQDAGGELYGVFA